MGISAFILALAVGAWAQAPQPASQEPSMSKSAAAGGSALPRTDPAEARRLFRRLDRNGDGYLSSDELKNALGEPANWAAVDRDRDGRISPSEFAAFGRRP